MNPQRESLSLERKKIHSIGKQLIFYFACENSLLHNIKLTLHVSALETWFLLLKYTPRLKAI